MRTLALATAAVLATSPASAAKLATPPVFGQNSVDCRVTYAGPQRDVTVDVQFLYPNGKASETRRFKMGPNNRIRYWHQSCRPGYPGHRCDFVACTFTFSVPASDVAGAVCATSHDANGCLPGRSTRPAFPAATPAP